MRSIFMAKTWLVPLLTACLVALALPTCLSLSSSSTLTEILNTDTGELFGVPFRQLVTAKGLQEAAREFWVVFGPGGKLHPAYFLAHKGHLVVEGLLLVVIGYLLLQQTFKPRARSEDPLTEKEVDQLCREWKPEPLTPTIPKEDQAPARLITSYQGRHLTVNGKKALNFATFNFLGVSGTDAQKAVARQTVDKYGVGSCGPRGFYGTLDVHLQLEDELCQFMSSAQAIVYSSDTATIASVIPAFANRKDVLVVDECCAYPIQQGAAVSRATVYWFKHNDMADLERVLKEVESQSAKDRKPLNRRLIVVEGIFANTGELAPLVDLVRLKEQYKYRLVVEESYSFGVLGRTGRGAAEHWGLRPDQVDVVCASMGNALGSVGGFCVGSEEIVEHQRLSGTGYCFSASLPPYLATAASRSLAVMTEQAPELVSKLQANAKALRTQLRTLSAFQVVGDDNDVSPLIHLRLAKPPREKHATQKLLTQITEHVLQEGGVLVNLSLYSDLDRTPPPPGLQVVASTLHTEQDIAAVVTALGKAARAVL